MATVGHTLKKRLKQAHIVLGRGPVYLCTYGRWRAIRLIQHWVPPRPSDLWGELELASPALADVRTHLNAGDEARAVVALVNHFARRRDPCFHFTDGDLPRLRDLVRDHDRATTIAVANELCAHSFTFRGIGPVQLADPVDWTTCPDGNTDWTWDLNRHSFFLTLGRAYAYTGDERYATACTELLLDWIAANPPGAAQHAWASVLEVAIRLSNWVWAFFHFRSSSDFQRRAMRPFLTTLASQTHYLARNLEHHAPNNHLLLEAQTLAILGLLFPEFKGAAAWRDRGLRILCNQVQRQVRSDGAHGEQSALYHTIVTTALLETAILTERNGQSLPADVLIQLRAMLDFAAQIRQPDGRFPLLGDSSPDDTSLRCDPVAGGAAWFGWSPSNASLDEGGLWLVGPERARIYRPAGYAPAASRVFPASGHIIQRDGNGSGDCYLLFDCGPFGLEATPNHGHADALSLVLYACGHTWLPDAGAYSYHLGEIWRNYFRGTAAHNTVVVDGQNQTELVGARHVGRMARASLIRWLSEADFDLAEGTHDGYTRLPGPVIHRRAVFFVKSEYWIVIDWLTGQGSHTYEALFHLAPETDWSLDEPSGVLTTRQGCDSSLRILPWIREDLTWDVVVGQENPPQGWISPSSGQKRPAAVLRYRRQGRPPIVFATVLYPTLMGNGSGIRVAPLAVTTHDEALATTAVALTVATDVQRDLFLWTPGPAASHKAFDQVETDGEVAFVRLRANDKVERAILVGGGRLLYRGRPLIEGAAVAQDATSVAQYRQSLTTEE